MTRKLSVAIVVLVALALCVPAAQAAPSQAPEVLATWIANGAVGSSAATLRAQVNPEGLATSYRFEYATEAAFLANGFTGAARKPSGAEAEIGAGNSPVEVSQTVSGLKTGTVYRYRIVASNGEGPTAGSVRSLTTDELGPVFTLPDARGWELVSPIDKNGGEIQGFGANFGGDVLQAAAAGGAVTYTSSSSFANAQGSPGASQYVSRRSASAWDTDNVTLASEAGAYGDHPDGVPYQLFTPDLASALILIGHRCEAEPCPRSYAMRAGAALTPLPYTEPDLAFAGASPDLAHLVLSTCAALTTDAIEVPAGGGCDPAAPNLYERSGGALRLINLLPGDSQGTPGARLAAQSGAISADGFRVYFSAEPSPGERNLYLRDGAQTRQVDAAQGGGGTFETASGDGSLAFFTKAGTLYRYDAVAQTSAPLAAEVLGVLGASADGAYVYYLGAAGLYLWHSGATIPIASIPAPTPVDLANTPPTTGTARVSADGTHLAFLSTATLADYDNRNLHSGQPESEVYLYTAPAGPGAGKIVCASCNPSGESPLGAASLPGASPNGTAFNAPHAYKPRVLSAAANRLFFDSFDALSVQDTNNDRDVYQWEAQGSGGCARADGCISLISSSRAEGGASFIDASADGADAFFLTDGSLVKPDPGSVDVYDARVGGGFPPPVPPIPCFSDLCQPLPPEPEDPTPGTLRTKASGNFFPRPKCKKGQVRKKGKCVKKKRRPKGGRGR